MIDLHNHILPGVDDGAATLEESLAIARQFASEGVTRVAATPHFNPWAGTGPTAAEVGDLMEKLQAALAAEGIELEVLTGSEILLAPGLPSHLEAGRACTLGGSRGVLIELPFYEAAPYAEEAIGELVDAGYRPVLAHPERTGFIQRDLDAVEPLRDAGALFQVTGPSLAGEYGSTVRRTAEALLERGLYSLAGSDRHHPGSARSLALAYRRLTELANEETARLMLAENPGRLLADEEVQRPVVVL